MEKSCCSRSVIFINLILNILIAAAIVALAVFVYLDDKEEKTATTDVVCSDNPCQNGGTCMAEGSKTTCGCPPGYIGSLCQYDNPCYSTVCQNGGSCSISFGVGAVCACVNGYSGETCEINRNPCSPNPCNNSGICTQVGQSYRCLCEEGYLGKNCDQDDPCLLNPCKHNGECTATGVTFHCTCSAEWAGKLCEQEITADEEASFQKADVAMVSLGGINLFILIVMAFFMILCFCQLQRKG